MSTDRKLPASRKRGIPQISLLYTQLVRFGLFKIRGPAFHGIFKRDTRSAHLIRNCLGGSSPMVQKIPQPHIIHPLPCRYFITEGQFLEVNLDDLI